jgi:hypothetical protein
MEALAKKIPEEIFREEVTGAIGMHLQEVLVFKVRLGLAVHPWGAVHEGEDLVVETSEDLREVALAADDLVKSTEKAVDISVPFGDGGNPSP